MEGSTVVGKIFDNKTETFGFDAQNEEYVDMVAKGIIDPAKVVRTALQDAASVAGLLDTSKNPACGGDPRAGSALAVVAGVWRCWASIREVAWRPGRPGARFRRVSGGLPARRGGACW